MYLANLNKKCDQCGLFLCVSDFHKNKSKTDGYQSRCKDCMLDYKMRLREGKLLPKLLPSQDFFYIPDIFLVGYARTQTFQHCCLACNDPFFCMIDIKTCDDLFCDSCQAHKREIPERNMASVNYVGNVVGWLAKIENPRKKRTQRNYKKCYERDKYVCQYCGYNLRDAKKFLPLHVDHIKPFSAQGSNSLNNLAVSCSECNLLVSDKWFNSFEEKKEFIVFERQKRLWQKV